MGADADAPVVPRRRLERPEEKSGTRKGDYEPLDGDIEKNSTMLFAKSVNSMTKPVTVLLVNGSGETDEPKPLNIGDASHAEAQKTGCRLCSGTR
ncbi:hypothetical protein ACIBF1_44350 [Spirillospora sp. NPDC050679]